MELKICHLYPDILNLYGDRGNIITMKKRLELRGINVSVTHLPTGEKADFSQFDIFFIGGGQDFEQKFLMDDLKTGKDKDICGAIQDGKVFLAICGGYQLLGSYYKMADGTRCDYLNALELYTEAGANRLIGNTACESDIAGLILGFENHGGRTYLGDSVKPLGKVLRGYGNNGVDGTEGGRYLNVFGTYYHGPVLPKNPDFCDFILKTALERKYGKAELNHLPQREEDAARSQIKAILKL